MGACTVCGKSDGGMKKSGKALLHMWQFGRYKRTYRVRDRIDSSAMFNVTGGEIAIILLIALVVLGPEKLPDMLRKAGRAYGEVRRMATGFQSEFQETFADPIREFRESADQFQQEARNVMNGDDEPLVKQPNFGSAAPRHLRVDPEVKEPNFSSAGPSEVQAAPVNTTAEVSPAQTVLPEPPADDLPPPVLPPWDGTGGTW
jgi:sec-independent protein translocase protein TatB